MNSQDETTPTSLRSCPPRGPEGAASGFGRPGATDMSRGNIFGAPQSLAFLFDLDGTLIDSMPHHHDAWVEWYARRGLAMDAQGFFAVRSMPTSRHSIP